MATVSSGLRQFGLAGGAVKQQHVQSVFHVADAVGQRAGHQAQFPCCVGQAADALNGTDQVNRLRGERVAKALIDREGLDCRVNVQDGIKRRQRELTPRGRGGGTGGHRDMDIISYWMRGELAHKDSMGNVQGHAARRCAAHER